MSDYRFDLNDYTIGDDLDLQEAAAKQDVRRTLAIANRFIPINLFALPAAEMSIVLDCFFRAVKALQVADDAPIAEMVRKALEDE